jgi:hypothetical protein
MAVVILIGTAAIMVVTIVIIKGKLLTRVKNFRTLYMFHTVIPTTSAERWEEHMYKIFALEWTVPICPYLPFYILFLLQSIIPISRI